MACGCPSLRVLRIEDVAHDINNDDVDGIAAQTVGFGAFSNGALTDGSDTDGSYSGTIDIEADGTVYGDANAYEGILQLASSAPPALLPNRHLAAPRSDSHEPSHTPIADDASWSSSPASSSALSTAPDVPHSLGLSAPHVTAAAPTPFSDADSSFLPGLLAVDSPPWHALDLPSSSSGRHHHQQQQQQQRQQDILGGFAIESTATAATAQAAPYPTSCPTHPITAAAVESLARHCPRLEELCLTPSFHVHHAGAAVESLAAGCPRLRTLRLTRFLGLAAGADAGAYAGAVADSGAAVACVGAAAAAKREGAREYAGDINVSGEECEGSGFSSAKQGETGSAGRAGGEGVVAFPATVRFASEEQQPPAAAALQPFADADGYGGCTTEVAAHARMCEGLLGDLWTGTWHADVAVNVGTSDEVLGLWAGGEGEVPLLQEDDLWLASAATAGDSAGGALFDPVPQQPAVPHQPMAPQPPPLPPQQKRMTPAPPPPPTSRPPLALFPALEELELQLCSDMTDAHMQALLQHCPALRRLEAVANHRLSAAAFAVGCQQCSSGGGPCAAAAANGGVCRARGAKLESVRVMQCDNVDSHELLLAIQPAKDSIKGIQMTATWQLLTPPLQTLPLPLASFAALESLCLELCVDVPISPLARAGLGACPNLKFVFLSLYGVIEDSLPLPDHEYSLSFLAQPPALSFLFLSLEGVQCASAPAMSALELSLLAALPSLNLLDVEFRPANRPAEDASPLPIDLVSTDAARLFSLAPRLRRITLGGVVEEPAMVKLLRSRTLRDVVFLLPPNCSDTFRSFFDSVLKSRVYVEQPKCGSSAAV
eukprot:TRINITY_DN3712_c3_g1_i4.p1 TRINITY_DN3712_c3_g1~~TRINITY_DN3712_c3_g1_i4.p1  ORF type:complete len:915 (-),score=24.59 TRINITY_DN3712_c3_g1_i4:177-2660(-)